MDIRVVNHQKGNYGGCITAAVTRDKVFLSDPGSTLHTNTMKRIEAEVFKDLVRNYRSPHHIMATSTQENPLSRYVANTNTKDIHLLILIVEGVHPQISCNAAEGDVSFTFSKQPNGSIIGTETKSSKKQDELLLLIS